MQRSKGVKVTNLKKKIQHLEFCGGGLTTPHPSSFRGNGLQVCLPLPKEVGDSKFLIPLHSHKLYLCLRESGVYDPL